MPELKHHEARECPPEFQDRLTARFGTNVFGEPLFKIVWGQSQFIRMGNIWRDKHGNERVEYRDRYQAHGSPCWVIMRWKPSTDYGTADLYYAETFDSASRLYITGEYPWKGRYEVMQPLQRREFVNGQLIVEHFPLSHFLIDTLIPMMVAFQQLSREEQMAARAAAKAAEDKAETEKIAEFLAERMPAFWGPVSFANGQGIKTALITRKMDQIQAVWNRWASNFGRVPRFARGLQLNRPHLMNREKH